MKNKNKIKIYGLQSHQTKERISGVDFARIIQPLKHLNGFKLGDVEFETRIYDVNDPPEEANWGKVAKEYDIIYLNYITNDWGFAQMGCMAQMYGTKIVMDLDDALWEILPDNPAYDVYKKGSPTIATLSCMCDAVDYMTTTNTYLKNVICNNTKKRDKQVKVFPNYIDLELYNHISPFKDELNITLLHHGSSTHYIDLENREFQKGIDRIMKEYPNVNIQTVGSFVQGFRNKYGNRYSNGFGHVDIYHWIKDKFPEFMDRTDILIVPLEDSIYTRCKSSIKYIETSSAKIPGVYQDIRQYAEIIEDGKNGFLAKTEDEWYEKIKKLIDDKELRKNIGEEAYKTTKENWTINQHVEDYAKFFSDILTES